MAFCTYCGQSFQRNEHLERHLTAHTNIKRFKCPTCHLSFSRADVLQRHMAIHGVAAAAEKDNHQLVIGVRPRTQKACRNCARTKTKCDSATPCNRCRQKKIPCDRGPKKKLSPTPQSVDDDTTTTPSPSGTEVAKDNLSAMDIEDRQHLGNDEEQSKFAVSSFDQMPDPVTPRQTPSPTVDAQICETAVVTSSRMDIHISSLARATAESDSGGAVTTMGQLQPTWDHTTDTASRDLAHSGEHTYSSAADIFAGIDESAICSIQTMPPNAGHMHCDSFDTLWYEDMHMHTPTWGYPERNAEAVEHQAVIEAYNYWSSFRCNPSKDITKCPRTAGVLLVSLSHAAETDNPWAGFGFGLDFPSQESFERVVSLPFQEGSRDRLSAISQSLFRKALKVHCLDPAAVSSANPDSTTSFLTLPRIGTIDHCLQEYMLNFEPFYPLVPEGLLDANALILGPSSAASSLLILLMIGQGATSNSTGDARRLSGGLTEVCRISLFDAMEKNVSLSHHQLLVHCAIIFVVQAAWSGDKWLMDIGLGQRGIYVAVVRNGRLLDTVDTEAYTSSAMGDVSRAAWLDRERLTRLAYAWVVIDLELSLFHDTNLELSIVELNLAIPYCDELYFERDESCWKIQKGQEPSNQPSLRTLFQWFLNDQLIGDRTRSLTPATFRLLLHPLHSLAYSLGQLISCIGGEQSPRPFSRVTKRSTDVRVEEVQSLLYRWISLYNSCRYRSLSDVYVSHDHNFQGPLMISTLIEYHVICLNTMSSFMEIESLARRRLSDGQIRSLSPEVIEQSIRSPDQVLDHVGQILHLLRMLGRKVRPPWWPVALYRASLILWMMSVLYGAQWNSSSLPLVLIDVERGIEESNEGGSRHRYFTSTGASYAGWSATSLLGIPALTNQAGGIEPVRLDDPIRTLDTCFSAFEGGTPTRFSEGIRVKLEQFLTSRYSLRDG